MLSSQYFCLYGNNFTFGENKPTVSCEICIIVYSRLSSLKSSGLTILRGFAERYFTCCYQHLRKSECFCSIASSALRKNIDS